MTGPADRPGDGATIPEGVRVRIAPSPTGYFHVGNARTAIFNWLFARQSKGAFVVRVEDTDRARYVGGALEDVYASLDWLGLTEDESPRKGGAHGPYRQSERLELYRHHVDMLLAAGHAYKCYCSPERLAGVRERRAKAGAKVGYDRQCRNLSPEERALREADGPPCVVRLKAPLTGEIVLHDRLRGDVRFDARQIEDVVLMKSDGFPTYHLAVVVDDHHMAISHVLRADEWIPSAPIGVLLYEAFAWQAPEWVHVPLVLNPGGKGKLSKRRGGDGGEQMTQVREFRAAGYLPEALFNFLALLGWSYGADEDVFTPEQALERFRLEDIKLAPAAWNPKKLDWMNGHAIRHLTAGDLARRLAPFLAEADLTPSPEELAAAAPLVQERITTLRDAVPLLAFLWREVHPAAADLVPKKLDAAAAAEVLAAAETRLAAVEPWAADALEDELRAMAAALDLKPREAFQPVRVAVTGARVAPPLFESLALLGRDPSLARLATARALLGSETVTA